MTRIPEAALHRIWEQRDRRTPHLHTTDGRKVAVIHAGTPNPDTGPDFLGAVIRIGASLYRGDVEIHTAATGWHLHHHDRDPRYNRVILHVAGSTTARTPPARTASGRLLPLLILPSADDHALVPSETHDRIIEACAARIQHASDPHRMLRRLGWARIRRRTGQFEHRLAQLSAGDQGALAEPEIRYALLRGRRHTQLSSRRPLASSGHWDQLVYEALMESMGYARNGAAFLLLARTVLLSDLHRGNLRDRERSMGILFGAAGLLPDPATIEDEEAASFVRVLQGHWQTWRLARNSSPAPEMSWVFFRLRPANFPTARIATTAHLLPILFSRRRLPALLRMISAPRRPAHQGIRLLQHTLTFMPQGFWSSHLHFHDRKKPRGVGLGRDRMAVIVLNALLPAALLYARATGNRALARRLWHVAHHIPAPHEPRIVRDITARASNISGRLRGVEQLGVVELARRVQNGRGISKRGQQA